MGSNVNRKRDSKLKLKKAFDMVIEHIDNKMETTDNPQLIQTVSNYLEDEKEKL